RFSTNYEENSIRYSHYFINRPGFQILYQNQFPIRRKHSRDGAGLVSDDFCRKPRYGLRISFWGIIGEIFSGDRPPFPYRRDDLSFHEMEKARHYHQLFADPDGDDFLRSYWQPYRRNVLWNDLRQWYGVRRKREPVN